MQDDFWISVDGTILSQRETETATVELTVGFPCRDDRERSELRHLLPKLQFSERSRLARIGIELFLTGEITIEDHSIVATAKAFVIDEEFPSFHCLPNLLRPGIQVGRLFHFPEKAKLNSEEIWEAIRENRLKLPNTLSIDRFGQVHFTPHKRIYKLPPTVSETDLIHLTTGKRSRIYLDKLQTAHDVKNLSIPPGGGLLSSCSMYLPNHFAVLHRGNDHFGLHTGAVLLDPVKTFGSNIMLEIYNSSDQIVVNPLLSIDLFAAPAVDSKPTEAYHFHHSSLQKAAETVYGKITTDFPTPSSFSDRSESSGPQPDSTEANPSALIELSEFPEKLTADIRGGAFSRTIAETIANAPPTSDTLVTTFFPNDSEQLEILAHTKKTPIERLVFRQASATDPFYLPDHAHAQLGSYKKQKIPVYWQNDELRGLYLHTQRRNGDFFIREEIRDRFQISPLLAFYGSELVEAEIAQLIGELTAFFGSSLAILTGSDRDSYQALRAAGRDHDILTGTCFLELETNHPPTESIDFFNSFQETGFQHRRKCFESADFCIFCPGGTGTLEAIGRELSNLAQGIRPRIPFVFFSNDYWNDFQGQIETILSNKRAPAWIREYLLFTNDPKEIVEFYRKALQVL